ncbi:bile acid:sodium symporter family protein [Robertkochia solimangrovi]|uniref:bile acid:sodium symporter family protein n=1 Tax=Robertkochia solimangrovi TaxID=2213046 RepID=UPI00117FD4F2|nr:bile acid:sodium symporter family protein [Robertkochia solimangrovi]TRZ42435.1 bile acid:sodium symporter [Robertkochia solimangrovi]
MKIDRFVLAILIVIGLAYIFPYLGSDQSPLNLDIIASAGISLIFFFYGLKLSPEKIKDGLKNWKLHLVVQLTTFFIFPLVVLLVYPWVIHTQFSELWLPFFFLAALPSTVSSSVVMVSIAKGNIPAAIFNASISGLIGIAITPLWMGLFLQQDSTGYDLSDIYVKLIVEILIPVILGLVLNKKLGKVAVRYAKELALFDKSIILVIIYKSFAESFLENVFAEIQTKDLLIMFLCAIALFFFMFYTTGFLSKRLNFSAEDRITAQFCGTKKSLVHGTVFSKILFAGSFSTGLILLPLMLFHGLQIFIISIIASKMAQRDTYRKVID